MRVGTLTAIIPGYEQRGGMTIVAGNFNRRRRRRKRHQLFPLTLRTSILWMSIASLVELPAVDTFFYVLPSPSTEGLEREEKAIERWTSKWEAARK